MQFRLVSKSLIRVGPVPLRLETMEHADPSAFGTHLLLTLILAWVSPIVVRVSRNWKQLARFVLVLKVQTLIIVFNPSIPCN